MKSKEKNYNEVSCDDQSRWGMLNDSDLVCNNYYGARCIAERSYDRKSVRLDFIPNRISFRGCRKDVDKIIKFVNRHVRRIEKFVHEHGLGSNSEYTAESPEGIKLTATPHGSYGYVYLKAVWNGCDKRKAV